MPRASRVRRLLTASVVGTVLLVSGAFGPAADAVIRRPERQLARLVNNYRADHGENRLRHKANIHRVAEKTAKKMAEQETTGIHTDLGDVPCSGRKGEVVGSGGDVGDVFRNMKDSDAHRTIIRRSYWQKMGVGVAVGDDDRTYAAVIFCD